VGAIVLFGGVSVEVCDGVGLFDAVRFPSVISEGVVDGNGMQAEEPMALND